MRPGVGGRTLLHRALGFLGMSGFVFALQLSPAKHSLLLNWKKWQSAENPVAIWSISEGNSRFSQGKVAGQTELWTNGSVLKLDTSLKDIYTPL